MTLPTGTITFLFTDIQGSTRLWQEHSSAMPAALTRHHALLRHAIETNRGFVFQIVGDAIHASFSTASDGLSAALAAQRALRDEAWGETGPICVRMALHTGPAHVRVGEITSGEYASGLTLSRAARLRDAGHGGQILLSLAAAELARDRLPPDTTLREMGARRLRDLDRPEQIFQVIVPDLPCEFPPLKTLDPRLTNLPIQLSSFIGREPEMARIKELLAETRLLTLTGAGGAGKTRLALHVAADLTDNFPDGLWFVELASLTDPSLVPQTVASVLGLRDKTGRPSITMLSDNLRTKRTLLILDNCEHLLEECAKLTDAVLRAAPMVSVLATSREPLGIVGEKTWRIPSLALPDPSGPLPSLDKLVRYAGVHLFIERARAVKPEFAITQENAPSLAQICQRLDGIPLAIELAAARVKFLSVRQIADRLNDRFNLLTQGSRTALPRQQTLRATVEWSYDLLLEQERTLFRRLSVFAGGWTLEAAEAVCAGNSLDRSLILELLSRLVDKSLAICEERDSEARYHLLETIRQFAEDRLRDSEETDSAHSRHLEYFVHLVEEAEPKLWGAEQVQWFNRLEEERGNWRAAMDWAVKNHDANAALRMAGALVDLWFNHGPVSEWQSRLREILSLPEASERTLARAKALNRVGVLYWGDMQLPGVRSQLEEALAISVELGDRLCATTSLFSLGLVADLQGDVSAAQGFLEQSLTHANQLGPVGIPVKGNTLQILGDLAMSQEEYDRAQRLFEESAKLLQEIDSKNFLAYSFRRLGHLARYAGELTRASELCKASLNLNSQVGDQRGVIASIAGLAGIAVVGGQSRHAAKLFGAVDGLLGAIGIKLLLADSKELESSVAAVRAQVDPKAFESAWEEGCAMTFEQAVRCALEETPSDLIPRNSHTIPSR